MENVYREGRVILIPNIYVVEKLPNVFVITSGDADVGIPYYRWRK